MARPKEFESEAALNGAIEVFSEHGFEGTSTDELLRVMGISRQSMYDTFGDKRQLYLTSLQGATHVIRGCLGEHGWSGASVMQGSRNDDVREEEIPAFVAPEDLQAKQG